MWQIQKVLIVWHVAKHAVGAGNTDVSDANPANDVRKQIWSGKIGTDGKIEIIGATISPVRKQMISEKVAPDDNIDVHDAEAVSPVPTQMWSGKNATDEDTVEARSPIRKHNMATTFDSNSNINFSAFKLSNRIRDHDVSSTFGLNDNINISDGKLSRFVRKQMMRGEVSTEGEVDMFDARGASGNIDVRDAESEMPLIRKRHKHAREMLNIESAPAAISSVTTRETETAKNVTREVSIVENQRSFVKPASHDRMSLKSVVSVAEKAFAKGMVSQNIRKAMTNVTLLLEGALSARLPWSRSDAEKAVLMAASRVQARLSEDLANEVETITGLVSKEDLSGLKKRTVANSWLSATGNLFSTWIKTGEISRESVLGFAGPAAQAMGLMNPMLGMVATFAFSFISGLFGSGSNNGIQKALEELYTKIMKETKMMIERSQMKEEVADREADLTAVAEELNWMPGMLGGNGTLSSEGEKLLLIYNIMLQHDVAKISYRIRSSKFGKSEHENVSNQWARAMFPIAWQILLLQTNLITAIGSHDKMYKKPTYDRMQYLVSTGEDSFRKWFSDYSEKAEQGTLAYVRDALNWTEKIYFKDAPSRMTKTIQCERISKGKSCDYGDENACAKMGCAHFNQSCNRRKGQHRRRGTHPCSPYKICKEPRMYQSANVKLGVFGSVNVPIKGCIESDMLDYYNTYLKGACTSIAKDVAVMAGVMFGFVLPRRIFA